MIPCGGNTFEVRKGYDAFNVDEPKRTCSCRMWQLSGLPCTHAIACIFKLGKYVEDYVPDCFRKDRYMLAYSEYIKPVDGIHFWPDCSNLSRILGPIPKKMPGRPKKKRVRASHEPKSRNKVSRAGIPMTCHNCGESGHNKKGCCNQPVPKPPKAKRKVGRPRKVIPTEEPLVDASDIPPFVNTSIDEFEMGETNRNTVFRFSDGRVQHMGRNFETRKKGKFGYVKMRGGKSKCGGLIPTQRLGRMGAWLGMDRDGSDRDGTSDTIEHTEPLHAAHTAGTVNRQCISI